jgi:HAE1 family hydrophobic/amphiphilic exporter-1
MLAGVASVVVFIAGLIAIPTLPIAQYPKVAPPQVTVSATYIGANARTVESAVTTPLEEAINGVEGLRYMTSTSGNDGTSTITVTFNLGRDLDAAQADVQNAVLSAMGRLPQVVQQTGVSVQKSSAAIILGVGIESDGRMAANELSDFAEHHVIDALKRIPGVADVRIFGLRRYAMRIWLDPQKLAMEGLTTQGVITALQSQNEEVAAGAVGSEPTSSSQYYQIQLNAHGRLSTPEQFASIVLKRTPYGGFARIRDVGRAEFGAEDYSSAAYWNGRYTVGFGILQAQNANALDVATRVRETLKDMSPAFPPGVSYVIPFDATLFVRESIKEVLETLALAILLVVLVIYAFIQDWRMALVPMITIPVSLVGTFALMKLLGFSINTLTLFGITLATGLVVDDAIVVIENIARFVHEKGMAPYPAAVAAMREISGAVVATSLVLLAVFIPVAFFPGSTGLLDKQFAVTIACSITISLFTALTLAPPLAEQLLGDAERPSPMPAAFIPDEDQGYLIVVLQTPVGTSAEFERRVFNRVGIPFANIAQTLGAFEGSEYVNDFDYRNNTYRVYVQADLRFRQSLSGLELMNVRSADGGFVPLSGLLRHSDDKVPSEITHFNLSAPSRSTARLDLAWDRGR